jgi:PAS domain S-box-containing protein
MKADTIFPNQQFLSGGGEMGALTRAKDWSTNAVGPMERWPQSLRTALSIILNSKFPMFLWWGPQLTCFYNDAYRPSLGQDGKHPSILGKDAKDAWPEIWDVIKPLIDQVLAGGEATWSEDQLIPIHRNGKLEDVYWTFSYSPVNDESGKVGGVLVTCSETTDKINTLKSLRESEKQFRNIVKQAPVGITILYGPEFIPEMANETYLQIVDKKESDFVGKPLFDSLPETREVVAPLLTNVLTTGIPFYATEISVALERYGKKELSYFNLVYHPQKEENKEITRIIVVATEVTASVKAKQSLAESEKQFRDFVMRSPIPMAIFRGEEYIIEMANTAMFERWSSRGLDFLGRKIVDVFPELHNQKYFEILNKVYTSGKAHQEIESIANLLEKNGQLKTYYFDYEYAPLTEANGKVSGILATVIDVTEKVEARKKVEDAEERLRLATEATELATWDLDLQTDEIVHSARLAEIFGYDGSKKLRHFDMRDQIHPDDKQEIIIEAFERAMQTSICEYEARVIKANKEICWIRAQGKVFFDKDKKPLKMLGTVRDITKERRHQEVLRESEEKFRLLADSMPQHIWTSCPDGNLNYFNKSVFDYSGLTPAQIYKEGRMQIVHPDDRETNIKKWMHSIGTGIDFLVEHRFRRYDGEYRWQLSRAIPQKDADGNIQMWVGTSTDIQRQKEFSSELEKEVQVRTKELNELNEALIKSEAQYHLMVEEVQDYAILYLNREGVIENWNKGAEKIKGYTPKEIIGKNFSVFYTDEEKRKNTPFELLEGAANIGKAVQEGWRVRKDGTLFWASVVITAVHDRDNKVIGFSKVTHDLTEKKEAEDQLKKYAEELKQKNKDLEKMNAELQSFAYISSHDLQEPLRKIQTFATRIIDKERGNLSETGKDYFERIQKAASRMQTLIEDLLTYSRTNTTDLVFQKTNLSEIVEEVKHDLKETLAEKKSIIDIGKMCEANVIHFQFRQLMTNLIGNALKFSKPGQSAVVKIKSELVMGSDLKLETLSPKKKYCHLTISDNGIGFDPTYKDRIFEVFQRLHSKDEYAGTGIGLAIVKKIVDNHNGVITATGELNKGATFDIYIPA